MSKLTETVLVGMLITLPSALLGEEVRQSRLLFIPKTQDIQPFLPKGTRLLHNPVAIEKFLESLDGVPPDWAKLLGKHGDRHDEGLFILNRERDRLRKGRPGLSQRITFLWEGLLSSYVPDQSGFLVAVGPEMIATKWGVVRFKPESLPAELLAVPTAPEVRKSLRAKLARGENVRLVVAMTGYVVPDEALIYDFGHEVRDQGMIMPMVRVEQIDYFFTNP